jgi:hypothetical protein
MLSRLLHIFLFAAGVLTGFAVFVLMVHSEPGQVSHFIYEAF